MYSGKINKYRFEHDSETNRIIIYEEGAGVEPISLIHVSSNISEKTFHYEIMSWYADSSKS
jgi:hypothetical protein